MAASSVINQIKVLTILKSSKLVHAHTLYLKIDLHACILRALWCKKKTRYCEKKLNVCLVVIGIRRIWKMEPKSQNLNSIFFLWIDITYIKVFCKNSLFLICTN